MEKARTAHEDGKTEYQPIGRSHSWHVIYVECSWAIDTDNIVGRFVA